MAKFVQVDHDTCIACGACIGEAPDVFDEQDDGLAISLPDNSGTQAVNEDFLDDLEAAVDSCPTDSIKVQDSAF